MSTPRRSTRGFSMIEMLVGVLIISFGLLGLITLQARALQSAVGTEDSQRASLLANEMAATIINSGNDNVAPAVVAAWAANVATPASGGLPGGVGTVAVNGASARITVTWTPVHSSDTHRYSTNVIP